MTLKQILLRATAKALSVNYLPPNVASGPDDSGFMAARDLTADDLRNSSVVSAPLLWMVKAFAMLEPKVFFNDEEVEGHPLTQALSDRRLIGAICDNFFRYGNSYLFLERLRDRSIETMAFYPAGRMKPKWTPSAETYYEWYPPGPTQRRVTVLEEELAHVRFGIDPDNLALGCSPLTGALTEVATDLEAAGYTSAILRNLGVMGIVASMDENDTVISETAATAFKTAIDASIKGTNRGSTVVVRGKTSLQQIKTDISGADLGPIRNISEERVCAALGISPAVVGFGTGLQQTKVGATMRELLYAAWTDTVLPHAADIATQLGQRLLPEFGSDPDTHELRFTHEGVEALQRNRLDEARRIVLLAGGVDPIISGETARRELDYSEDDAPEEVEPPEPPPLPPVPPDPAMTDQQLSALYASKQAPYQHDMIRRIDRAFGALSANMERELMTVFNALGEDAARVADDLLTEKQTTEVEMLMDGLEADLTIASRGLDAAYNGAFLATLHQTYADTSFIVGLSIGVPDPEEARILAQAGTRRGLVDLTAQTRQNLFRIIAEARDESLGVNDIVARIRHEIPAGPHYLTAATRARVIARTEVKFAQREASLSSYRSSGRVDRVLLFDNRTSHNDADCMDRDGRVVSFHEAQQYSEIEHPNSTLDFAPVIF